MLARQFLLSPWLKEKRLRNQLRLVLKVRQRKRLRNPAKAGAQGKAEKEAEEPS